MELSEKPIKESKTKTLIKVLVADDDPPTRILLRTAISQWGYQVIDVSDGEQAWQVLQEADAPRLLILDWLMPKLDGAALCERIKQQPASFAFRPYIILLTQMTGTANVVKALEAGADEFLSKPFNMTELRSRLSVGARIVKYDKLLYEKNNELQHCIVQMENITKKFQELSAEIKIPEQAALQKLQQDLQVIINTIKKLKT